MATRTITISLVEQSAAARTLTFTPRLSSADGDVVLKKKYTVTTDANGDATIALPTKATGTITYDYKIPRDGGYSNGTFHLSAGSTIDLDDLLAAGGEASDTTLDYVDAQIAITETYVPVERFGVLGDGTTDNTAAFQDALDSVRDSFGGTLVLPNGITNIEGALTFDGNTKRGAVRIIGQGGNSVLRIVGSPADSAFYFANCPKVTIEGITFLGTEGNVRDFSQSAIWFNVVEQAIIRDCRFIGLSVEAPIDPTFAANKWHGVVVGRQCELIVEQSLFGGCGTGSAPNIGVDEWYGLTVRDTQFLDFGYFGNTTYGKIDDFPNEYWIRAINPATPLQAVNRCKVTIENVSMDEGNYQLVYIDGAQWVELNNLCGNIGNYAVPGIYLNDVHRARLTDCMIQTVNMIGTKGFEAHDCGVVTINDTLFGGNVETLTLSGTTDRLNINYSEGYTITNSASATVNEQLP